MASGQIVQLHRHPDSECTALTDIMVEIARSEFGQLVLRYVARGDVEAIKIPKPVRYAARIDGLWQTTCFEAFVQGSEPPAYCELNFAPSTAWAAYIFSDYRSCMMPPEMDPPHFDVHVRDRELELVVAVDIQPLNGLPVDQTWHLGLSAVIEETGGQKSYWALAHPPGKPDFHHPDCFALELPAMERP